LLLFYKSLSRRRDPGYDRGSNHLRRGKMGLKKRKVWLVWLVFTLGVAGLSLTSDGLGLLNPLVLAQENKPPTCDLTFSPEKPRAAQTVYFEGSAVDPDKDGGITKWEWRFGDSPACPSYCSSCTGQNVDCRFPEDGRYPVALKVTAKDNQTCTKTKHVVVETKPPIADFSFSPVAPMVNQLVCFTDASTDPDGGSVKKWQWDFGDRGSSSERHPCHRYAQEGKYEVSLTVTDDNNLTHTISKKIVVGGTRMGILLTGGIPTDWGLTNYEPREFTVHFQPGDRVVISRLAEGEGEILVRTTMLIEVNHADNTRSGLQIEFCDLPLCGCASKGPQEITQLFQPGKNHVSVILRSKCGPALSSTSLWLVRFSSASASSLMRALIKETTQLRQEGAAIRASWDSSGLSRLLYRARRVCTRRPDSNACATMLENVRARIEAIDLGKLLELVKRGLPEIGAEIETLIESRELVQDMGRDIIRNLEQFYRFLCGLEPTASDCEEMLPVTPIGRTWPEIEAELTEAVELLGDGRFREGESLLAPILVELNGYWQEIDARLTGILRDLRAMQRSLKKLARTTVRAQEAGSISFALLPSLLRAGSSLEVRAGGGALVGLAVQLFALDGRLVLERSAEGNQLQFSPLDQQGRPLANGVYLYVITARAADGAVIRSTVRKLVILR
jgi:PKD repeat protein